MPHFNIGAHVKWTWGADEAEGIVVEAFTERIRRTIKGTSIVRNASIDKPAYLVGQASGAEVLKSGSELKLA